MQGINNFSFPRVFGLTKTGNLPVKNTIIVFAKYSDLPGELVNWELEKICSQNTDGVSVHSIIPEVGNKRTYIYALRYESQQDREALRAKIAETARTFDDLGAIGVFGKIDVELVIESVGFGIYAFPKISSIAPKIKQLSLYAPQYQPELTHFSLIIRKVESVWLARDLVNLPPNYKNPEQLEAIIRALPWQNTRITTLQKLELIEQSFGLLLAVGSGSDIPPRTLVLERMRETRPTETALVGKGVTFDAGWLQIKPDTGMLDMKLDMAGAAAVVASFWYADAIKDIPVSAVGSIGLVENLVGGSAFKPLDVLTSHSGKTVEVHHTDAEGRLVLGDLVSHIAQRSSPKNIITLATLTGACMHALGYNYAGLMGNEPELLQKIESISHSLPEKVWRLPLDAAMMEATKSEIADYRNATSSHKAGASMGAAFIANFVPADIAYAHLDIAAPAYRTKASGIFPSEATGFGTLIGIALLGL
jgi:leucyl aminopeptidase